MATTAKTGTPGDRDSKVPPGASWQAKEEQLLPENRMGIVLFGLMCTMFLSALDQTIVATALPTIVAKLGGGNNYGWVGSSYLLAAGAFGPLYGKMSNMFGRKPILYSSIVIFLLGSALCGAAQNMTWLIISRAVQGIGGGGIIQLVFIVIADIVPLKDRGRYGGIVGATYCIASVAGPLLGGVFAQHVSWRWCFFINLPTGGVAAIILFIFLNLNPHESRPFRDLFADLDFIGLFCLVAGVASLLIGFDFSQSGWGDAKTIAPIVVGVALLIAGGVNEVFTKQSAILPARLFKTRTTSIILVTAFLHALIFFEVSYYLPLYYQVLGASATGAGVKMLPFSLVAAVIAMISGSLLTKIGKYRQIIWVAYAVATVGFGVMIMLDYNSSTAAQLGLPVIVALGLGSLFQVPLVALQAAMPLRDVATASSAFVFLRTVGGAVGIAVGEAVISSVLPPKLVKIPGYNTIGFGTTAADLNDSIGLVHLISNVNLRDAVLHAWAQAISTMWIMSAPISGFLLFLTLFLREYSLNRRSRLVKSGEFKLPPGLKDDPEVAPEGEKPDEPEPVNQDSDSTPTDSTPTDSTTEPDKGKMDIV